MMSLWPDVWRALRNLISTESLTKTGVLHKEKDNFQKNIDFHCYLKLVKD